MAPLSTLTIGRMNGSKGEPDVGISRYCSYQIKRVLTYIYATDGGLGRKGHQSVGRRGAPRVGCILKCVLCYHSQLSAHCANEDAMLLTDHFARIKGSFFGHICSNVSVSIFHCESTAVRMDRWTDDFTLVCPEISVEAENLAPQISVKWTA